jgi:oxalate decarboxylase
MKHRFPFHSVKPQISNPCGSRTSATKSNFPILDRLSLHKLVVKPGCFREPHWHANADELNYCTQGSALVTIFASGNQHIQFTVSAGEMFFIPSGQLHAIESIDSAGAEFILTLSHEEPEDFGLSGFAGCLTPAVLGNAWGLAAKDLAGVTRSPQDIDFGKLAGPVEVPWSATFGSPYKYPIEAKAPLAANSSGSAIVARRDVWPILRAQGMYSVRLTGTGMREPHWHPETAELGYVVEGKARMTIQSPGGSAETYELAPGDIYFIPRAYPHHIENLTDGKMHFLIFFDSPDVQDIGLSGGVATFSDRMLGPTLGLKPGQAAKIPRLPSDLLLVKKTNPVDR